MKHSLLFSWLCIPVVLLSGQILLKDSPAKGEWHFHPQKIWEINNAENDDFGRIAELLVSDKEYIYVPNLPQSPVHEKKLMLSDLSSGEEKTLVDFSETETKLPNCPMN